MIQVSLPIIVALMALYAVDGEPSERKMAWGRLLVFVMTLLFFGIASVVVAFVARWRIRRQAAVRERWASRVRKVALLAEGALVVTFLLHVVRGNLTGVVDTLFAFVPLANTRRLVAVFPFMLALLGVRLAVYETQRQGESAHLAFLAFQLKLCSLPIVPMAFYLFVGDFFEYAPLSVRLFAASHPSLPYLLLFLSIVAVSMHAPALLRWLWKTEPLENPIVSERLRAIASRYALTYRRVSVWHTGGLRIANAAVAGIVPKSRELFVTDWLLKRMSDDEVEGVLAHELGHLRHRHLYYYLVFSFCYFGIYLLVFNGISMWAPAFLKETALGPLLLVIAFFYLYFVLLLGFVSREFERQADYFAVTNMRVPEAYVRMLEHLGELNTLSARVRRLFEWSRTHPSLARRVEFTQRVLSGEPSVQRYGQPLWAAKLLLALVPVALLSLIVHRDGVFGSQAGIHRTRAVILLEEVERLRRRFNELPPDSAEASTLRLEALNLSGQAQEELEKTLALEPETSEVLYLYGLTNVYADRRDLADRAFQKVLALDPHHAGALYALSSLYADRKEWQRARYYLERADSAAPGSAQIAELRRRIQAQEASSQIGEEP